MRHALLHLLAAGRQVGWLLLALSLTLPALARPQHHARHQRHTHHRHVRLPKMLPTVIPAARDGYETVLRGRASWYARFFQGHRTTSGERYDRFQFTCAHKTLPFGTRLRVTNVNTGKTVVVRVTDRGPFRHQRILDLAECAARPLGVCAAGAATVVAVVVPADTPLGLADTPGNLAELYAADPQPWAPFTAYLLPILQHPEVLLNAVATLKATPAATPYVVQAGTFTETWQAEALLARLRALDAQLSSQLETTTVAGHTATRVIITGLDSWLAAETVRRNLQLWGLAATVQPRIQIPVAPAEVVLAPVPRSAG